MKLSMTMFCLLSLGISGLLCTSCEDEKKTEHKEEYLAKVNSDIITIEEYQQALDEIKQAGKGFFANNESASRIKRDLLERLIDQKLLLQEAHRKHITLDPVLVDASMKMLKDEYPDGGVEQQLKAKGLTDEEYARRTRQSLLIQKLLKQEVVDRIAISSDDISNYYNQHKDRFVKPEEVRVRQIVTKTKEEAEDLRKRILRGESFEKLAKSHSLGPEKDKGGDLGWFPRGRMPPEIEKVAFKLWPGTKVSKVIESPYGFHLFQPVGKKPARELTLDQASKEIERVLRESRTKEAERFYTRSLREHANIDRDLQRLERIQ